MFSVIYTYHKRTHFMFTELYLTFAGYTDMEMFSRGHYDEVSSVYVIRVYSVYILSYWLKFLCALKYNITDEIDSAEVNG